MTADAPRALPGLDGRTVLVAGAEPSVCLVLVASGATVLAVAADPALPRELVDAGTGLSGALHYRSSAGGWPAVADWIGEQFAGVHGAVLTEDPLDEAVRAQLVAGAPVVSIGEADAGPGDRCHRVTPCASEDAAAVVAFLLSELGAPVRRADLRLSSDRTS